MPVVLTDAKLVFLQIPKTGGTWVRKALDAAGVAWQDHHPDCSEPCDFRRHEHTTYDESVGCFPEYQRFTIIRNPFSWYLSYHSHHRGRNWKTEEPLACDKWLDLMIECYPEWYTNWVKQRVTPDVMILRTESLFEDLFDLLVQRVAFDRDALRDTPRANVYASNHCKDYYMTEKQAQGIAESEKWMFEAYNYSTDPTGVVPLQ